MLEQLLSSLHIYCLFKNSIIDTFVKRSDTMYYVQAYLDIKWRD